MGWFANRIVGWQRAHGRHDLPWQASSDAYRIWVSEVMLQQTQVAAVIPYYLRFVERFPDVATLASATEEDVLRAWSGLGYYSRARNLHACARRVAEAFGCEFPRGVEALAALPGIGRSTAGAIAAFAFGARAAILDGNVKRVLCRFAGVDGYPGTAGTERALWALAERELPARDIRAYTQGLMDLGATVCTRSRPRCAQCPVAARCVAAATGRTGELPSPRPARPTPLRQVTMLVFLRGDEVLLEKRPPTGIWGGLWSLPETGGAHGEPSQPPGDLAGKTPTAGARRAGWGLVEHARLALEPFEHAFTHFRLRVQPVLVEVAAGRRQAAGDPAGTLWLPLAEVDDAALPRPVKSLLQRLRDDGPVRAPDAVPGSGARSTAAPAGRRAPSASASPSRGSAGTRTAGSKPSSPIRRGRARRPSG